MTTVTSLAERRRAASVAQPRRFIPRAGLLPLSAIRGPWRPSGVVGGVGVFAIVWATPSGGWWAALHDFEPAAQRRLIEACRLIDQQAGGRP